MHQTLRPRRKLRSLHTHNALLRMQLHAPVAVFQRFPHPLLQKLHQPQTERIPKLRMRNYARAFEKTRRTDPFRAVDELRR